MSDKYMSVNQFLDMFFGATANRDKYVRYFANVVNGLTNNSDSLEYISNWMRKAELSNELRSLFEQYVAAMQDKSPEARDFLNMAQTLTFFMTDAWHDKNKNPEFKASNILNLVNRNTIKNPNYSYVLLRRIPDGATSPATLKEIRRAIAQNPYATSDDAAEYAILSKSPDEIRKLINDFMVKKEQALAPELNKEFPNEQRIKDILADTNSLRNMIAYLSDLTRSNREQFAVTKELEKMLDDKFNIQKIMNVESGNYIQQYKEQAELQLAKMKPEMDKMRQDLATQRDFEHQQDAELENTRAEIEKLKQQLQQKETALQKLETKYNTLNGTLIVYIRDVEERANGSMFNKGKDLAELALQLKNKLNQKS